ncbi:hypothetical protein [Nocardioides montaniterrae]
MTSRGTTFRQVDPSVVADDPFWSTVMREHPDATYVLLPPPRPTEPVDPLSREEVRAAVAPVLEAWQEIVPLIAEAGPVVEPAAGWRGADAVRRFFVEISHVGIGRPAGVELMARVGVALGLRGWTIEPERRDDRSIVRCRGRGAELIAVAGDGATVLTLLSPGLAVDDVVAADLRREVRAWL